MESLRELYRIGTGPSSSHTMGPQAAARIFRERHPDAAMYRVILYGSLAAASKGHLTNETLARAFAPSMLEIEWREQDYLPRHPNGMEFQALDDLGEPSESWVVYSVGGGEIRAAEDWDREKGDVYPQRTMAEVLAWSGECNHCLWELVEECEGPEIWDYLRNVWKVMLAAIKRGLEAEGPLPGPLKLARKASSYYTRARNSSDLLRNRGLLFSYALAVSEENAAGGEIVTAPTCGSCGVLPAVLHSLVERSNLAEAKLLRALATAGLIGNLVKHEGSISGAEVGCQGEIGTACAMAAAAATQLLGGTPNQIEYAAEMGIEHHLGLTCDPVLGYVQIPCIERNAIAAGRALECAVYASFSDGRHRISFDDVVAAMKETGQDIRAGYRETSTGGLAKRWKYNTGKEK